MVASRGACCGRRSLLFSRHLGGCKSVFVVKIVFLRVELLSLLLSHVWLHVLGQRDRLALLCPLPVFSTKGIVFFNVIPVELVFGAPSSNLICRCCAVLCSPMCRRCRSKAIAVQMDAHVNHPTSFVEIFFFISAVTVLVAQGTSRIFVLFLFIFALFCLVLPCFVCVFREPK